MTTRHTDIEPGIDEAHLRATFSRYWRASWGTSYTDAMLDPVKRAQIIEKARETSPRLRRKDRGPAFNGKPYSPPALDQKRRASGERDDEV